MQKVCNHLGKIYTHLIYIGKHLLHLKSLSVYRISIKCLSNRHQTLDKICQKI